MDKVESWANYQAKKELGPVTHKTYNIAETNGQNVQMSQDQTQPLPANKHLNPSDLGVVAQVTYRITNNSTLRHKRFSLTNQKDQSFQTDDLRDFLNRYRAKAELKETPQGTKWVITDKGRVDYMVVSYISQNQLDLEKARTKLQ